MRRHLLFLAIAAAILAPALRALVLQAQEPEPPITAQVPACPSTATLDQLISAIDSAVSGPGNQDRTCFRQLFLPDARLIPIRVAADGTATPRILTVQDWIDAVAKRGSAVFYEHQVKVRTETWAHMAHLWSTYETRTTPDGKPPEGKVPRLTRYQQHPGRLRRQALAGDRNPLAGRGPRRPRPSKISPLKHPPALAHEKLASTARTRASSW